MLAMFRLLLPVTRQAELTNDVICLYICGRRSMVKSTFENIYMLINCPETQRGKQPFLIISLSINVPFSLSTLQNCNRVDIVRPQTYKFYSLRHNMLLHLDPHLELLFSVENAKRTKCQA